MATINTILVPLDFSKLSDPAFTLACSLARDHRARLVLLTVVEPPAIAYGESLASMALKDQREKSRHMLEHVKAPDDQVKVERRIEEGDPADQIVAVAKSVSSDLIVMGTHGWTGLSRLLMGSVAEQVVRKAPCPVLTVKVPIPQEPDLVASMTGGNHEHYSD